jgi:hypothetical protein
MKESKARSWLVPTVKERKALIRPPQLPGQGRFQGSVKLLPRSGEKSLYEALMSSTEAVKSPMRW